MGAGQMIDGVGSQFPVDDVDAGMGSALGGHDVGGKGSAHGTLSEDAGRDVPDQGADLRRRRLPSGVPDTPLRISEEALGAVIEPVVEGRCNFAIRGSLPINPPELRRASARHPLPMVAAPAHKLAMHRGPIPTSELARHVQPILSDRSRGTEGEDLGVFSPKTWRLSDLGAKHTFLLAGLGWGGMPLHVIEADLASGALVPLTLEDMDTGARMSMSAIYRTDAPPGPAGRWLLDRLKQPSDRTRLPGLKPGRVPSAADIQEHSGRA